MKQGKAARSSVQGEKLIQMMTLKNIVFTFLFRSPDSETYHGCLTHSENLLGITFGLMRFYGTF